METLVAKIICRWIFLVAVPLGALAPLDELHAAEWWHTSAVTRVYPIADGRVALIFETDHAQCTNANSPKYYYFGVGFNSVTQQGFTNMLSVALAATMSGRDLIIAFDDSTSLCYINRMSIGDP